VRKTGGLRWAWPLILVLLGTGALAADEYSFDSSEFEKKPFELGGWAQLKYEGFTLNQSGALYKLNYYGQPQRQTLGRTTGTLELIGKVRHGIGTFDFHTHSEAYADQLAHDNANVLYEGAYSVRANENVTIEAGKRVLNWGKGYTWNPMAFTSRAKNPDDPLLAREGYVMATADLITSPGGDLQTIAFTPVLLPVGNDVNSDFGATGHLNPAAKLYLLYKDTDIDFAWQGKGSRPARYGMDFAKNITSNFEVHGEWARIQQFTRPVTDASGRVVNQTFNATSYLLGLRYLTESDTTYIAEYYRNGTGYSDDEFEQFYQVVNNAFVPGPPAATPLLQKAVSLSRSGYGRPNPGQDYVYFRAQQKDALGIVYFQPSIFAVMNLQDRSFQVAPELLYTGFTNTELRARLFVLQGGAGTEFGEKANSRKLEIYARFYF
jgi:hypothetical protein